DGNWVIDTLSLGGTEVPVQIGYISQSELSFFPENPRLYSIVHASQGEPTQHQIEEQLVDMEHVRELVQSIRANGGLTDPVIVRKGDYVVLEGNSRLAAFRVLARNDPIKWGRIKAMLLPEDISDNLVFALLGQYHIVGKKDWAPYEQAGYFYRRNQTDGLDPTEMAKQVGVSTSKVNHLINVYKFMVDHDDNNVSHWSYYDQFLSKRVVKAARSKHPQLDSVVVAKIKSGEIAAARTLTPSA
ncbi:MAG: ParB N-terminal domain-containing protein, partial [Planctomycetes bacterium]|nr:ParB N-terminal domain-containing protein [Planctomycetota bacterium]